MIIRHSIRLAQHFTKVTATIGSRTYTFLSIFECNVAKYLELLKFGKKIKDWKYEPKTFRFEGYLNKPRSYLIDFRVVENDGSHYWLEAKGQLKQQDWLKYIRMAKHYPAEILEVIMQRIPTPNAKLFSVYAKVKQLEGGAIRRIIDGSIIMRQIKGII